MSEAMRQLASTLIAAADENKKLRRQIKTLTSELDTDKQLQEIRRLKTTIQDLETEAVNRDTKLKRLTQEKGQEKHRADMLEVKVNLLSEKRPPSRRLLVTPSNSQMTRQNNPANYDSTE